MWLCCYLARVVGRYKAIWTPAFTVSLLKLLKQSLNSDRYANTGWFFLLVRQYIVNPVKKSVKRQNFLRVWHLVIFRAYQQKNTLYIAIWLEHHGNRLYGFMRLWSKMLDG